MSARNPLVDDLAKMATGALGAAQAAREEFMTMRRARQERMIADLDLVPRADFEAQSALLRQALEDIAALKAKIADLEVR